MRDPILEDLFNFLVDTSKHLLDKYGEMYPHAASADNEGKSNVVGVYWGDEHPRSQSVLDEFDDIFRDLARRGQIAAAGVALNARIKTPELGESDAIIVHLEHKSGDAVTVSVPYVKKDDGSIEYGEAISSKRKLTWFAQQK